MPFTHMKIKHFFFSSPPKNHRITEFLWLKDTSGDCLVQSTTQTASARSGWILSICKNGDHSLSRQPVQFFFLLALTSLHLIYVIICLIDLNYVFGDPCNKL